MRLALLAVLVACTESRFTPKPLPELVRPERPIAAHEIDLLLDPGESMVWEVSAEGMTIGRAELVVEGDDVRSRFTTGGLASMVSTIRYELFTHLDRAGARPASANETLVIDGNTKHRELAFDGRVYLHTLHSALGWLRSWAAPDAPRSQLFVTHAGHVYQLLLDTPIASELHGTPVLRIDGRIDASDPISITIWLSADRKPARIVATDGTVHVTAELVTSS